MRALFTLLLALLGVGMSGTVWGQAQHRGTTLLSAANGAVGVSAESSGDFDALLQEYRSGDADRAVTMFSTWTASKVRAEARLPEGDDDVSALAALMLLHSEAEVRDGPASAQHYATLRSLGDRLDARTKNGADPFWRAFCRDWFVTQLAPGQRIDVWTDLSKRMPDDPTVQLALGTRMEFTMQKVGSAGPNSYAFRAGMPVVHVTSHGQFGPDADQAITRFRRALELDSTLVEARVRLGRVLLQLDRWEQAEQELERARVEAHSLGQPASAYLAGLFLAQLADEQHRRGDAISYLEGARADYPDGQAARLALGRLLTITGREADGWTVAASAMIPEKGVGNPPDPFTAYFLYQYRGLEQISRLRGLRRYIRQ